MSYRKDFQYCIGMDILDVKKSLKDYGFTTRIVVQDGRWLPVTDDIDPTRIDIGVDRDIVTKVWE